MQAAWEAAWTSVVALLASQLAAAGAAAARRRRRRTPLLPIVLHQARRRPTVQAECEGAAMEGSVLETPTYIISIVFLCLVGFAAVFELVGAAELQCGAVGVRCCAQAAGSSPDG